MTELADVPFGPPFWEREAALLRAYEDAVEELVRLKETNNRLNRRCQSAESAAQAKVEEVQRAGPSLGRSLANWYGEKLMRENKSLRAQHAALVKEREKIIRWARQPRMTVISHDFATDGSPIWFAECPELPGCQSHGLTESEARANIEDAITEYLLATLGEPEWT